MTSVFYLAAMGSWLGLDGLWSVSFGLNFVPTFRVVLPSGCSFCFISAFHLDLYVGCNDTLTV